MSAPYLYFGGGVPVLMEDDKFVDDQYGGYLVEGQPFAVYATLIDECVETLAQRVAEVVIEQLGETARLREELAESEQQRRALENEREALSEELRRHTNQCLNRLFRELP